MPILSARITSHGVARRVLLALSLPLALGALEANAEIRESIAYIDYPVEANNHQSLASLLSRASPIRHAGKTFHAYTTWRVNWQFLWQPQADGSCRITQVNTGLDTTIQLPFLNGGNPQQQERFQRYLGALKDHELGHHHLGRMAAQEVDERLRNMPAMLDCQRLVESGNRLAQYIVEGYKEKEETYDLVTVHGRVQGARLDY